jgi:DNA-binding response OmpR family regulator
MTKILVADDDTVMLKLLTTLMQLEGNEITTVTRPAEIMPAVERERPDLIMMDFHLAGGDVMETLVDLRSREELASIPVLVASGMDHETACLNAGADGFILKPFRPTQLLERIHELLGG